MAAESFFSKVANDVLQATERIASELEEGLNALFGGSSQHEPSTTMGASENTEPGEEFDQSEAFYNPLEGFANDVIGDILKDQKAPTGAYEQFQAFRHAITWSEPFIISLIAFQAIMFLITMWVSQRNRSLTARVAVMIFVGATVRMAERLNRYGAQNWGRFATQNYFDGSGIFVSIMLCSPLLLDSLIMLLFYLREASQLLVQVKTAQIKQKRRNETRQQRSKKEN